MAQLNKIRLGQPNLTRNALMSMTPMRGFGLVVGGLEIPDDLIQTASREGAVIVFYRAAVNALAPDAILAANPSGEGEGFAVVSDEAARQAGLDVVYDPILAAGGSRSRASWRTLGTVFVGTLVVGGALWLAYKD